MNSVAIRFCDLVLSCFALIVFLLPMLLIAILIRASDGNASIFRQIRVGVGGKNFTIYKFRTMSAGPVSKEMDGQNLHRTRPGDVRITRVGRYLRPSHLDELPQLINVLLGDMSIVGVRPDTPGQKSDYTPAYWEKRHTLRPGITGPAQLMSSVISLEERCQKELLWINSPSFVNYLKSIGGTVLKIFRSNSY